jgi:hypothetical protein
MELSTVDGIKFQIDEEDAALFTGASFYLNAKYIRAYFPSSSWGAQDHWRVFVHVHVMGRRGIKDGRQVDHIDQDKMNNCKSNLRILSQPQQMYNLRQRGEYPLGIGRTEHGKFRARAGQKQLGNFNTLDEAIAAREKYLRESVYDDSTTTTDA